MPQFTEFPQGQLLQHLKTGGFYKVLYLAKMEATLKDVYVYEALVNGSIWIRPKDEMEDGRFAPIESSNLLL
jgi:hypothetical protein